MVLRILRFQLRPLSLQLSTAASTANLLSLFFFKIEFELKSFWLENSKHDTRYKTLPGRGHFFHYLQHSNVTVGAWIFCSCKEKKRKKKQESTLFTLLYIAELTVKVGILIPQRQNLFLLKANNSPFHHPCCSFSVSAHSEYLRYCIMLANLHDEQGCNFILAGCASTSSASSSSWTYQLNASLWNCICC